MKGRRLDAPHPGVLPLRRITIETTRQVGEMLDYLVARGLHGFDVADCVDRLLCEKLREVFQTDGPHWRPRW